MEHRPLGRTGLSVSVLGLGAAPLGGLYVPSSDQAAYATLAAATAAGVTLVDVAPHYGQGLAERRLGQALARLPAAPLVLSTKVGRVIEPDPAAAPPPLFPEALPGRTVYDASRHGILRSIADSRARTGRDGFDILLLHDPDRQVETEAALRRLIEEAYRTLAELRDAGHVRAIGIGVNAPAACHIAIDVGAWDCFLLAGSYSVLRQEDAGLLDRCQREGISVLIGGPYLSGVLAGGNTWRYRPVPADVALAVARLRAIGAAHGVPLEAAALQFPLRHPAVAAVLAGMRSADELEANVRFLQHPIPAAFWQDLASAGFPQTP